MLCVSKHAGYKRLMVYPVVTTTVQHKILLDMSRLCMVYGNEIYIYTLSLIVP